MAEDLDQQALVQQNIRYEHFSVSRRDTLVNDLKNSTGFGILSFAAALFALILLGVSVYLSYQSSGNGGFLLGILAIGAGLLSILAVVFGILGLRNHTKTRHYVEKRGIVLGTVVLILLTVIFIRGLRLLSGEAAPPISGNGAAELWKVVWNSL